MRIEQSFTELSARERAFALLDAGSARELLGPFAHLKSPHLLGQGIVAQNDDGMIVVRGAIPGPKGGIVYLKNTVKNFKAKGAAANASINPQKASARTNPQKASARNR